MIAVGTKSMIMNSLAPASTTIHLRRKKMQREELLHFRAAGRVWHASDGGRHQVDDNELDRLSADRNPPALKQHDSKNFCIFARSDGMVEGHIGLSATAGRAAMSEMAIITKSMTMNSLHQASAAIHLRRKSFFCLLRLLAGLTCPRWRSAPVRWP